MTKAYYNEFDPFAASWLRELIKAGHICEGDVDERSIEDVKPSDIKGYTQCHFFAGIGIWSYALRRAGWPDDREVWTGSCPCQSFSAAGKRAGFADERHLWPAFYHLIQECNPRTIFGEQVASKDGLAWLDLVQTDLEAKDYTVGAIDTCAAGFGAPHIRQRLYWMADPNGRKQGGRDIQRGGQHGFESENGSVSSPMEHTESEQMGVSGCSRQSRGTAGFWKECDWIPCIDGKARPVEPGTFPLAHGVANRVGLLRGYGNSLVAPQAQAFIEAYLETER